jgi:hypothetical protein
MFDNDPSHVHPSIIAISVEMLKALFSLKGLRRANGTAGMLGGGGIEVPILHGVGESMGLSGGEGGLWEQEMKKMMYVTATGTLSWFPTKMHLVVCVFLFVISIFLIHGCDTVSVLTKVFFFLLFSMMHKNIKLLVRVLCIY